MKTKFKKFLHKYHLFSELILLAAIVPFVAIYATGGSVKGENRVVAGVQSHLVVEYDGETYDFSTFKTSVIDAVSEQGIETYKQDEFSLSRETRLYGQDIRLHIEKSLPVIIYDNGERLQGRTTSSNPERILEQNNIKYWPEDVLESELIQDPILENGVGQLVRITRAPVFRVHVDGGVEEVRSWAMNVSGVLEGKVSLGEKDVVKPTLESLAEEGDIYVTRINVVDTETTASIPYKTVTQNDYYVPEGQQSVVSSGTSGTKKQKVRIRYENGKEVSRTILSETVVTAAKNRVVKKGLMPSSRWDFNRTYWNMMVAAASKYGNDPVDLFNVASCESHVNPNSINPAGYYGMFQYALGFWNTASAAAGYSGAAWNNGEAQIYTTAKYTAQYGWGRWGCKP